MLSTYLQNTCINFSFSIGQLKTLLLRQVWEANLFLRGTIWKTKSNLLTASLNVKVPGPLGGFYRKASNTLFVSLLTKMTTMKSRDIWMIFLTESVRRSHGSQCPSSSPLLKPFIKLFFWSCLQIDIIFRKIFFTLF